MIVEVVRRPECSPTEFAWYLLPWNEIAGRIGCACSRPLGGGQRSSSRVSQQAGPCSHFRSCCRNRCEDVGWSAGAGDERGEGKQIWLLVRHPDGTFVCFITPKFSQKTQEEVGGVLPFIAGNLRLTESAQLDK